ncbi:threonine/serine exporter family protein [Brachybacterium huguangmaarense]
MADPRPEPDPRPRPEHPVPTTTSPIAVADSLTVRSEAAAAVGSALLAGGMASFRVKTAMALTARALGLDSFTAIVTFTDITATATLGGRYRTRITRPPHVGVDVDRLVQTHRMVERLPERVTAAEVFDALAAIAARPAAHGALVTALAAGVACAAFAFLNGAGVIEMTGVLAAATAGQALRVAMQRRHWNHLLITVVAATVTTLAYALAIGTPVALGALAPGHQGGYLAAVLFLVPGFPLITGLLDLVRSDFSAGIARLAYALMIILGAAGSVWAVGVAVGLGPQTAPPPAMPFALELGLRALATFAGVLGFAVIFRSPWRIAVVAAVVSLVANSLRFALTTGGVPPQLATLAATALVGALAYAVARVRHIPRTAISVPAVVIMIPGFTLYGAFTLMNTGDVPGAMLMGLEAVQVILAAGLGLALAHLATSPSWRLATQPA